MDVCDSISFGSADHAFLSPGASARQNIMAVLYPSLADCQARQNRIAVVQANVDTDISVNNHPVDVGAVRITS
ncbi:MAG: hypothetical protein BJ554DRAFT_5860 [Olpidium bornovanus]|uniref:Uncharacterized protein n=1 Tax=Olpidium bornovanus TaxID=278681 RepID=A0A8H7ZZ45_9FUNG|nr:MAG: hypothetical protein BJ554DRAFT_5860 [Olpidium bornovanus]